MANTDGSLEKGEKIMPQAKTAKNYECGVCGAKAKLATPTAACAGVQLGVLVHLPDGKSVVYTDGSPRVEQDADGNDVEVPWRVDGEVVKVNADGYIFSHDGKKVLNKDDVWEPNPDRSDRGYVPGEHRGVEMEVAK